MTVEKGGDLTVGSALTLAGGTGSTATLNVADADSLFKSTGVLSITNGQGFVNITNGGAGETGNATIGGKNLGSPMGGTGTVVVSGDGSRWDTSTFHLANGSLSVLDGGLVTPSWLRIAFANGSDGTVLISGAGSEIRTSGNGVNSPDIGTSGDGTLTVANGGKITARTTNGSVPGTIKVGTGSGSGTLNIGGGTGQAATDAGMIDAASIQIGFNGGVNFNHTETDYVFDIPINGDGAINQLAGRAIQRQPDGLHRADQRPRGALTVNGILGGTMDVYGGRLQGNGAVGNTTNHAGGMIAPGNSIGTLPVAGNYTSNGGGLEIESVLGGDGSPSDLFVITGNSILGSGPTQVGVINLGGVGTPTVEGIKIIDVGGTSDSEPHLPKNQPGKPRVDDRRVISGILPTLKTGGRWRDVPQLAGTVRDR